MFVYGRVVPREGLGLFCFLHVTHTMPFCYYSMCLVLDLRPPRAQVIEASASAEVCVTRRKQHRPGITPNDNTTHVPTAGSSAALT